MSNSKKFVWKIDHQYKNTGSKNNKQDEFIRKVWVDKDHDGLSTNKDWGIPNSSGIRGLAIGVNGIKKDNSIDKSAIFCITVHHSTGSHNPWEDSIDNFKGQITYWGDAKYKKNKEIDEFDGNKYLKNIFDKVLEGNYHKVPPIFYFLNIEQGVVEYKGLCVLEDAKRRWTIDKNKRIKNYHFTLGILDSFKVNPEWIKHRAKYGNDNHPDCPKVWKDYKKNGTIKRLQAWRSQIRSTYHQLPSSNSKEEKFLNSLKEMLWDDFEKSVVTMLKNNSIVHTITQTRKTKDGGIDMVGKFSLPDPFDYEIIFKGEVKRHRASIGPDKVSRLVARLRRGEYGLFFTTSYYTKQAQEEVIRDGYPVRLFSGIELYNLFDQADMIVNGRIRV